MIQLHRTLPRRLPNSIWWMYPALPFAVTSCLVALGAVLLPESVYQQSWRTPKYFFETQLIMVLLCVLAFAFGCFLAGNRRSSAASPVAADWTERIDWNNVQLLFRISFTLCMIGYLVWIGVAISRGVSLSLILGAFTAQKGATYELRESYLGTVTGITTMTQFGIAAVVFGVPLGIARGWRRVALPLALVFGIACLRVMINSERLAVIELVIPFVILYLHLRFTNPSRAKLGMPGWVQYAPLIGVAAVFVLFTVAEYSRSWVTFYQGGDQTLLEFAGQRLLGYYATALNNGALLMDRMDGPLGAPYHTMYFLWRFPVLGQAVRDFFPLLVLNDADYYMQILQRGANPEFNNPDGILLPIVDFGLGGGLLYWMGMGIAIGSAYRSFVRKNPAGLCWFPSVFVGLMEVPRILYWADGRFFPAVCMFLLGTVLFRKRIHRQQVVLPLPREISPPVGA